LSRIVFNMGTNAVQRGATAEAVSANVKRLRKEENLGLRSLSNRLSDVGRPLGHSAVDQIEKGTRRVDVDDLLALAVALRVSPVTLLMPEVDSAGPKDRVTMTGTDPSGPPVLIPAQAVWEWLTAQRPIVRSMELLSFGSRAWPKWVREHAERQIREEEQWDTEAFDRLVDEQMGGGRGKDSDGDD
jgi:transcriptional regulator with XRE-family HTH domain